MATVKQISDLIKEAVETLTFNFNKKIEELCKKHDDDMSKLTDDVVKLQNKVSYLEDSITRHSRLNQVTIRNIPANRQEDLHNIFQQICSTIGYLKSSNYHNIYRIVHTTKPMNSSADQQLKSRLRNKNGMPSTSSVSITPSVIIVCFATNWEKTEFMNAYFKYSKLCLTDIGFSSNIRIYIGDNLTPINYNIYRKAGSLKKEGKIFSIKLINGLIYVARKSGDRAQLVSCINQLMELA